jgi:hypothetical protein
MRFGIILAIFAVACFSAPFSWGQTATDVQPSAEKLAAARELLQVMRSEDQLKVMMPIMLNAVKGMAPQGSAPTEAQLAIVNEVSARRANEYVGQMATIYARNFTLEQIHDLEAFYRSPTGQALVALQPQLAREGILVSQQWAKSVLVEVAERLAAQQKRTNQP